MFLNYCYRIYENKYKLFYVFYCFKKVKMTSKIKIFDFNGF